MRCSINMSERAKETRRHIRQRHHRHRSGTIQRQLLVLEQQGGDKFFGEPALKIADIMRTTRDGRGAINVLAADKLMSVAACSTRPSCSGCCRNCSRNCRRSAIRTSRSLVFFFDEAHLLFDEAPKVAASKRSSRSSASSARRASVSISSRKTRSTCRIPCWRNSATASNTRCAPIRRASRRRCKTAAETFRPNPDFDTAGSDHQSRRRRSAGVDAARPRAFRRWSSAR